jgi:hypothetical protein
VKIENRGSVKFCPADPSFHVTKTWMSVRDRGLWFIYIRDPRLQKTNLGLREAPEKNISQSCMSQDDDLGQVRGMDFADITIRFIIPRHRPRIPQIVIPALP